MALATLSIDLEARLAQFEGDLGKANRLLDKFATDGVRSANAVRDVFAGTFLASSFEQGLRAVIDLFPSLVEGAGRFQDLADTTGGSAEGFARFQTAADVAGVSVEELAGLSIRLTSNLGKITDEGKGAGQALANLGIPIKELQALSPDQQLARLSAAFNDFEDGVGKTSNALALFGRNGPEILKFFKEYGDGLGQTSKLTAEQIKLADDYADKQARLKSEFKQSAQVLAVQFLPTMGALGGAFFTSAQAVLDLKDATGQLSRDRAILDWAESGAIAVATFADSTLRDVEMIGRSFVFLSENAKLLGKIFTASGTDQVNMAVLRTGPLAEAFKERDKAIEQGYKDITASVVGGRVSFEAEVKKSFAAQRAAIDPDIQRDGQRMAQRAQTLAGSGGARRQLPPIKVGGGSGSGSDTNDTSFERLLDRIRKQGELAQAELSVGEKLGDADRARITLLQELTDTQEKLAGTQNRLTESQVAGAKAEIEQTVVGVRSVELQREQAKAKADAAAAADRVLQQLQQEVGARQQLTGRLAEEVEEIGLSTRAVEELRTKRLENALATEEEAFFQAIANDATREQIDLLAKLLELKGIEVDLNKKRTDGLDRQERDPLVGAQKGIDEYLKSLQEKGRAVRDFTRTAAQSLEDDLVGSLRQGRLEASRTIDYILDQFLRLRVVQPLMQSLFGNFGSKDSTTGGGGDAALAMAVAKFFGFSRGASFDMGNVQPFAAGAVFHSPHFFKFANGGALATGVLGEAGPEAIMPLRRGADGRLGVQVNGRSGGNVTNIYQTVTVGSGVSVADVRLAMAQTKQETIGAIADLQRRGFIQQ